MSYAYAPDIPQPGFSFDLCNRNEVLQKMGFSSPEPRKTGTTVAGIIFRHGVVLGADTRATDDKVIADKNCLKVHHVADNMYCCGAGVASDIIMVSRTTESQLKMLSLHMNKPVLVQTAATVLQRMLFRYGGRIQSFLLLGGVDSTGPHVFAIYPSGSVDKLPYTAFGSGGLSAMAQLEARWEPDMSENAAKLLVCDAVKSGIFNDPHSGSNVDLCIIKKNSCEFIRGYDEPSEKGEKHRSYAFKPGTTEVLKTKVHDLKVVTETVHKVVRGQPIMEFNKQSATGRRSKFYKFYDDSNGHTNANADIAGPSHDSTQTQEASNTLHVDISKHEIEVLSSSNGGH